jgi:ribosomal protein L7/L12
MDLETAQRIERLEYAVGMLWRHLGLDPDVLAGVQAAPPPIADAVPPGYAAPARPGAPALPAQFYDLVRQGKKIQAIKMYREATGAGLKQAKDFVDGLG